MTAHPNHTELHSVSSVSCSHQSACRCGTADELGWLSWINNDEDWAKSAMKKTFGVAGSPRSDLNKKKLFSMCSEREDGLSCGAVLTCPFFTPEPLCSLRQERLTVLECSLRKQTEWHTHHLHTSCCPVFALSFFFFVFFCFFFFSFFFLFFCGQTHICDGKTTTTAHVRQQPIAQPRNRARKSWRSDVLIILPGWKRHTGGSWSIPTVHPCGLR